MGGIECSSHRLRNGKRLDLIAATQHDIFLRQDCQRLEEHGICTIRSGLRWHLIETAPYHYDFSSVLPMLHTTRDMGMQVIWDIFHYGWPDDIDIFSTEFIRRLTSLTTAFARLVKNETDETPFLVPINEISFMAWAGGEVAHFYPFAMGQGFALKSQLVRAAIAATEAIWDIIPDARIIYTDPAVNILPDPMQPENSQEAESYRRSQYQAWDMLSGRLAPELGGHPKYLDIIGVNYYWRNQWIYNGEFIYFHDPRYKPFRHILQEVYERYQRPMFIAETGVEDDERPDWLHYIGDEAMAAINMAIPIEGLCLYPIFNHPGWDDDRHCYNGLWDYADEQGNRPIYQPMADELYRLQLLIEQARQTQQVPTKVKKTLLQNQCWGIINEVRK